MSTATLYRPLARNAHGDAVNAEGKVVRVGEAEKIGTVDVVMGGPNWQPVNGERGNVTDTSGLVGVRISEPVQPRSGDLLVLDGVKYSVRGNAQWTHANGLTGTAPRYSWFTVTATN